MKVTKCDKCRKEVKDPSVFESHIIRKCFYSDNVDACGVWERKVISFDLCDDCAKRVEYWIIGLTSGGGPD